MFARRAMMALAGSGSLALAASPTFAEAEQQEERKEEKPKEEKRPKPSQNSSPKSVAEMTMSLASKQRVVFLTGHIDDKSAQAVIAQLLYLEQEAPGTPIHLQITSGGGKVYAGLAIHDVMQSLESPVATTCLGHCESMAAVLLAAGAPGHRYALANSRVMVHQPTRSGGESSKNAKQLQITAAETEKSRMRLAQILADGTGRALADIELMLESDHYYSAPEAIEVGLVDHVGQARHFSNLSASAPNAAPNAAPAPSAAPNGTDKSAPGDGTTQ